LDLPPRYRIYNTFPISLLELFKGTIEEALEYRKIIDVEPEKPEYEVEAILAYVGPVRNRSFLVKWVGYLVEDNI
jgi:hypothetical protein